MDTEPGRSLIVWTVRAAVALYAAATWRLLFRSRPGRRDPWFSLLWIASWGLCAIHVVCAFQFEHNWSHAAAERHTAEVTERTIGIHWGGGIYINYVFLLWWGGDAICSVYSRSPYSGRGMQITAAFIMLNATAVFGPRWWWIPVLGFALLIAIFRRQKPFRSSEIQ